jgi:hypothetical protein
VPGSIPGQRIIFNAHIDLEYANKKDKKRLILFAFPKFPDTFVSFLLPSSNNKRSGRKYNFLSTF